jgi:hypothetical protein
MQHEFQTLPYVPETTVTSVMINGTETIKKVGLSMVASYIELLKPRHSRLIYLHTRWVLRA